MKNPSIPKWTDFAQHNLMGMNCAAGHEVVLECYLVSGSSQPK